MLLSSKIFSYNSGTFIATWDVSGVTFENGNHTATVVAAEVTDSHLNNLDGDDDGYDGDDYTFTLHRLFCDANGDRKVDIADHDLWLAGYDPLGMNSNDPGNGDWNLDGLVDGADLELWMQNYDDVGLPTPPPSSPPPPEEPPAPPPEDDVSPPEDEAPPPQDDDPPPEDEATPPQDDTPPDTDEEPEHPGRGNGLDHKPDRPNKPDKPRRKAFNTDNLSSNTSIYDPMPQEYELLRSGFLSDEPDAVDVLVDIGVELSEPPTAQIEMANVDQNNQAETDSLVKDRSVLSKVSERRTDWFRLDEEPVRSVNMAELLRPNHISQKSLLKEEVEMMMIVQRGVFLNPGRDESVFPDILALDPIDRVFLGAE